MNFHEGDSVVHWTFGLGKISQLEERDVSGQNILYYVVQIGDLAIWVPVDSAAETRLRAPTPAAKFEKLVNTLSKPSETLPADRHQRKILLADWLKDGRVESLFRVIRSLVACQKTHPLSDNDHELLKRSEAILIGEWTFSMSIPFNEAQNTLHRMLAAAPATVLVKSSPQIQAVP